LIFLIHLRNPERYIDANISCLSIDEIITLNTINRFGH